MADPTAATTPTPADAEVALARLEAFSADLRGAVIVGPEGEPLAASGDAEAWEAAAKALFEAADDGVGEGSVSHVHVGTEDGEVYALRGEGGYAIVAAADRLALASLLFFDMRSVLRDLVRGPGDAGERGEVG